MTRSHGEELTPYDPEIERTFHQKKNAIERGENSGETDQEEQLVIFEPTMDIMGAVERPMMEYSFPTADGTISSIVKPSVEANNFEINPSIIQIIRSSVQFYGLPDDDLNKHLMNFLEICDTFRFNGVSNDAVRLRIFPFSLCDTAKDWLQSLPAANRATIDAAAGGTIMKKLLSEAFNIIDEIATNLYSYGQERVDKRTAAIHSIDAVSALSAQMNAQMTALTHKVDNLGAGIWNGAPIGPCGACGQMEHWSQDCKMPSSAKFLKEVLSTKRKWEGGEMVKLNEECSAISQNKLPPKLKDTGSFSIPCTIENINFDKVLCDLGASLNLMPYSIFEKLGMHELTPSIITLQLADRSIKYPRGIVEDVLIKVGKFIVPVDFIVLDMEEDKNMSLILGRPLLATSRALIDVQKCQLTLRVNDEHVVFNVFKPMKYLHKKEHDIFAIDSINTFGTDVKCEDPKEDCIENSNEDNLQDTKEGHEGFQIL
ncbi:UNVERIFIED_CONTAM: hypothetical protein Slati_4182600 [Sesamum latifolium]|uniref:Uncharacterized protein n=1 Tax=Sesamum latifolium TaxID=2727402 RepID=A0AAW2TB70_9LAMI